MKPERLMETWLLPKRAVELVRQPLYLGSIGGPAAILAKENIRKVEIVEFPELGMEAICKIEVEDFPAFILVDDKGNDFFAQVGTGGCGVGH